jgi:hypothetical protein
MLASAKAQSDGSLARIGERAHAVSQRRRDLIEESRAQLIWRARSHLVEDDEKVVEKHSHWRMLQQRQRRRRAGGCAICAAANTAAAAASGCRIGIWSSGRARA